MSLAWAAPIVAAGVSGLFGKSTAKQQYEQQKKLWEYQQKNAHQFEVEDLRKAGLNPILSATSSGNMASMPSVSSGADVMSPIIGAITDFVVSQNQNKTQERIAKINAEAQKYSADAQASTADKDRDARKPVDESEIRLNNANADLADITKGLRSSETKLNEQQIKESAERIKQQWKLVDAQVSNINSSTAVNNEMVSKLSKEVEKLGQDIEFTDKTQGSTIKKLLAENDLAEKLARGEIKAINVDKAQWNVLTGRAGSDGMTQEEFDELTPADRIKWTGKAIGSVGDSLMDVIIKGRASGKVSGTVLRTTQ